MSMSLIRKQIHKEDHVLGYMWVWDLAIYKKIGKKRLHISNYSTRKEDGVVLKSPEDVKKGLWERYRCEGESIENCWKRFEGFGMIVEVKHVKTT